MDQTVRLMCPCVNSTPFTMDVPLSDTYLPLGNHLLKELLPPEIGRLTNLTELWDNSKLTALPPEIGRLTNLIELHVVALSWTLEDTSAWLEQSGAPAEVYEVLCSAGVMGSQLMHLSDEDLEELGISATGPRDELVELVEKLRDDHFVALANFFGFLEAGEAVPASFKCLITLQLMEDPVIVLDGCVYEAAAIRRWLKDHDTSPMTGSPMAREPLLQCRTLRSDIQAYRTSGSSS
eukprot:m51a1_g12056 hypothetical protein (236) ;mRNA; f:1163-4551